MQLLFDAFLGVFIYGLRGVIMINGGQPVICRCRGEFISLAGNGLMGT